MIAKKTGVISIVVLLLVSVFGVSIGITGVGTFEEEGGANEVMGDVIEIFAWEDLHNMRDNLTASYRLMNDLGLSDVGYDDYASLNANGGAGWLPIGTDTDPFTGIFHGDNYTIQGLYIDRPSTNFIGLFGYIDGGEVSNIGLVDANVSGHWYLGGLVGMNDLEGTVSNSYATGNVSGDRVVGGLVGRNRGTVENSYATGNVTGTGFAVGGLMGSNQHTVSNSYATGSVSGDERVGGLVGFNFGGTVSNSHADVDVTGSRMNVGGLVGYNHGTVSNSYATGNVSGGSSVGGLVGLNQPTWLYPGTVVKSYATGTVSGDERLGGLMGENDEGAVFNSYATGTVTRLSGTSADIGGFAGRNYRGLIINCYSTGSVHYKNAGDPTNKGFVGSVDTGEGYEMTGNFWDAGNRQTSTAGNATGKTTAEMITITIFTHAGWDIVAVPDKDSHDSGYIWNIVEMGTYPFFSWQEEVKTDVFFELVSQSTDGGEVTVPGEGTSIHTEGRIVNIVATPDTGMGFVGWTGDISTIVYLTSAVTTITMDDNKTVTANFDEISYEIYNWRHLYISRFDLEGEFTLMNDLDETTEGYDQYIYTHEGWEPIGDIDAPFTGTFDGDGYEIRGLYINRPDENSVGLFGSVADGGEIRNVGIVDVDVTGGARVGGLVGKNYGTVDNSYATGSLSGTGYYLGGLVGRNEGGTVSNSYATGNVSGDERVGGLVGDNWGGTVENSYATGTVSGNRTVGGLVSDNWGMVSNSHATGNVSGKGVVVGGLMGSNWHTVENSYATGTVSGIDGYVGGLVGNNLHMVSNSYATGHVSGGERVGGLVGNNYADTFLWTGTVVKSYATGTVSGNEYVGGLVGRNSEGTVENSYATGTVTRISGSTHTDIGGFVGYNYRGKIINCYSTGIVNYEGVVDPTDKGFAGSVDTNGNYEMTGNFWDMETSGQTSTSGNATGLPTAEMKTQSTFTDAGWDFGEIWHMVESITYPLFQWQELPVFMVLNLYAYPESNGWNFVSFNLAPADTSLTSILADIEGNYDRVMYYDASTGQWNSYVPGRPDHFNNLRTWDHTMGLWIRMTGNATLTVEGYVPSITDVTLYPGWNIIGLPSESAGNHDLPPEVTRIGHFDASEEYNIAYTDDVAGYVFEPGQGYWVYNGAHEPVIWTVEY